MSWCQDICDGCKNRTSGDWCEEYNKACVDCFEYCRRNNTILSGDDIESQDDYMAWQMM